MDVFRNLCRLALVAMLTNAVVLYGLLIVYQTSTVDALNGISELERLRTSRLPVAHLVSALDQRMGANECALLFRQSDYSYYGRKCFLSHLDPRLLPLYEAPDHDSIRRILREHRVRFVYLPAYGVPEAYNTLLEAFIADPANASIVWDLDQSRLFEIRPQPSAGVTKRELTAFGSERRLRTAAGRHSNSFSVTSWHFGRDFLTSGAFVPDATPVQGWAWEAGRGCDRLIHEPRLRGFRIEVEGRGYLIVQVLESGASTGMRSIRRMPQSIWDGAVNGRREIQGQYIAEPGQCEIPRLKFSVLEHGHLRVIKGSIFEFSVQPDTQVGFARQFAELSGWTSRTKTYSPRSWDWGADRSTSVWTKGYIGIPAVTTLVSPPLYVGNVRGPYPEDTPVELTLALRGTGDVEISVVRLSALQRGITVRLLRAIHQTLDNLGIDTKIVPTFSHAPGPHGLELMARGSSTLARVRLGRHSETITTNFTIGEADALGVEIRIAPQDPLLPAAEVVVSDFRARARVDGELLDLYDMWGNSAGKR